MKKYSAIFFFLLLLGTSVSATNSIFKDEYYYKIFQNTNGTFGYDLLKNNKIIIHQPFIPSISGKKGFTTKNDAILIAKLAVSKINSGQMFPTISIDDLKNAKILLK